MSTFDELVAEGERVPTEGWDFSWFEGRATEERTPWGYSSLLARQYSGADAVLDLQTGGGEVVSRALQASHPAPTTVAATEGWHPNFLIAREALAPWRARVVEVANDAPFPFDGESFDVVSSRHPTSTLFDEVARVLKPGGTFISQQVTPLATNRELYEFFLGPQKFEPEEGLALFRAKVAEAGLELVDLQYAESRLEFFDVGAVVYFLRKVFWTVPDFALERYRDKLIELQAEIDERGAFVSYSRHALVVARKP